MPDMKQRKLSAMIIPGSVRSPSYTHSAAKAIGRLIAQSNSDVIYWDMRERPLPIASPEFHHDPSRHSDPNVREFVAAVSAADALVLATPIYHNGPSGVLKNALDHLTATHFHMKPIGLVSHGGRGSTQAVEQLRIQVRGLSGYAIVTQVCTSDTHYSPADPSGTSELVDPMMLRRCQRFADELLALASVLPHARRLIES